MKLSELGYNLPQNLIANSPAEPRDHSKLLIIYRQNKSLQHKVFYEIESLLSSNDVLVFNKTKVFPARLFGTKETGGKVELLLLEKLKDHWKAIYKGKLTVGSRLNFPDNSHANIVDIKDGIATLEFSIKEENFQKFVQKYGVTPLPPYIHSNEEEKDLRKKYQTVYARTEGSVAAPTAGFHFTESLLDRLKEKGAQMEFITLHVGLGTFAPIKENDITKHPMHSEWFELEVSTARRLNEAKKKGKRIIAVGTTTTRVLETCALDNQQLIANHERGSTNLFIYPPYKFKFVDAMITNFHLPKSTLLALVSAFVTYPNTKEKFKDFESSLVGHAYVEAIEKAYRFYSFGDAMLIE